MAQGSDGGGHPQNRGRDDASEQWQFRPLSPPEPPSLADPFLIPFKEPDLDPAEFLNAALPLLQQPRSRGVGSEAVSLAELSTQTQTIVSQLNAHTTRLTSVLTQMADDIMRSGSRLTYEVELLRGEALTLSEALTERLESDIAHFVPGGVQVGLVPPAGAARGQEAQEAPTAPASSELAPNKGATPAPQPSTMEEPPYVRQLRTLTLVRSRLESVIKTFGDAMEFVFPPSELSVSSSFLSVSGPDPGSEKHSTEEKGQLVLQKLRDEISQLLYNGEDPVTGIENAANRIEELKKLARVWKGTAEEKGRTKFIESLARMVEDRHRDLVREAEQSMRRDRENDRGEKPESSKRSSIDADAATTESKGYGGYGLLSQLQKLRSGL
ncbi:hypothetical protein VTK73DRAFT_4496 [Phialemonium thermophilum]|uniref:Uncharacterized protein n=1 Tax=Phialemonium thermophilum TaxID=223376 RepID=A0ABR3WT21_9PEZI